MSSNSKTDTEFIKNFMNATDDQKKKMRELASSLLSQPSAPVAPRRTTEDAPLRGYVPPKRSHPEVVVDIDPNCGNHVYRTATKACDKCNKYFCVGCIQRAEEKDWCMNSGSGKSVYVCEDCKKEIEDNNYTINCCMCVTLILFAALIAGILIYASNNKN